jgi:hypothetical protein
LPGAIKQRNKAALTQKVQLTAGIYAAKALVQLLRERFHDPETVHIFIPGVLILYRRKFCVQEVLMHICLLSTFRVNMGSYVPMDHAILLTIH